jgi:hypothetical protein
MVRLFIENNEIELTQDVQVAITKQFEDLSNPTVIINDWSKTISIPFTVNNNKIFGHIYNIDKMTVVGGSVGVYFNPLLKLDFRLEWDNIVLMMGYAKLNEIKQIDGVGTYEVTLFGELGKVFQEMKKITFDTTTEDTNYLIHGEDYVNETITKELVLSSWTSTGQTYSQLYPKYFIPAPGSQPVQHPAYRVTDIIGFAPNNSFSEGFDYKIFQDSYNTSIGFADELGTGFTQDTGIEPSYILKNGMLPREIGEYRSYLQLPYIYWNKLFQLFQYKAEEITGYQFELDSDWFSDSNPYWHNLVYMLKPFELNNEETITNYYEFATLETASWGNDMSAYTTPQIYDLLFYEKSETINIVDSSSFVHLSSDYTVDFNSSFSIQLNIGNYNNLRINPANGLEYSIVVADENSNTLDEFKYLMVDNDYSGSTDGYVYVSRFGRKGSGSFIDYPDMDILLDKGKYGDKVKLRFKAVWLNKNAPFLDGNNQPFTPSPSTTYWKVGLRMLLPRGNTPYTCYVIKNRHRSYTSFILNTLWDKQYNLFSEIMKYCKMYRISITVDEYSKKIKFQPMVKYFTNYTISDWTDKIDKSKDFVIMPITFDNKYIVFGYKDSDASLCKTYKEKYGVNYGDYRLLTDYNFNSETKNLFEDITPSITNTDNILSWTNLNDEHRIIYSFPPEIYVYNKDEDNKQVDIFGAYYFHNGLSEFSTEANLFLRSVYLSDDTSFQRGNNTFFYAQSGSTNDMINVLTYPKLDIVCDNNLCVFNTPKENFTYLNNYSGKSTIYSNFWENYLNERYNIQNKKITCYVTLKPHEYSQFKWNKLVKIGNQLCIVNKIYDYDITNSTSTKVDLITIQDIEGYTTNNYN